MKLNIANPPTGAQKLIDIEDERKLRVLMDKRMASEVKGDDIGEEFKGYIFKITGGNDKQGFPMRQGVATNGRVRLLMDKNHTCYRPRRSGERKRKSVRGCIVGPDLAVVDLVIVKQGDQDIPGLTDRQVPRRLGPKRANKIRKLFNLSKEDDVRRYVVRREILKEGKKKATKAPKIQRLITPVRLQRKRRRIALRRKALERSRQQAQEYAKLIAQRNKEKRQALISKRRQMRSSVAAKEAEKAASTGGKPAAPATGKGAAAGAKGAAAGAKGAAAPAPKAAAAPPKTAAPRAAAAPAPKGGAAQPKAGAAPKPVATTPAPAQTGAKKGGSKKK